MMKLRGKVSWFGGPKDTGVSPGEGLAFIYEVSQAPHLFLSVQPPGTTGLARRLNPDVFYVACRWDYKVDPKHTLLEHMALVHAPKTGRTYTAYPADWGPHVDTDRVADISLGLMTALGIETDDEVEVTYPHDLPQTKEVSMPYKRIVISSGHGNIVRGASCPPPGLDEVNEARKVVDTIAYELKKRGVEVKVFHDNTSTSQGQNLNAIVNYHNAQERDLDVSVHFNAFERTDNPRGTEVLYVTQKDLAAKLSQAIANCGFINRGAKHRTDLKFLNATEMPAVLLEICFVDSYADAELYHIEFEDICDSIADVLGGIEHVESVPPPEPVEPPAVQPHVNISTSEGVLVYVNGRLIN